MLPRIAVYTVRDRVRMLVRMALPPRRARLTILHTAAALERLFRAAFVDAVLIDLAHPTDDVWQAAALAREYPSAPFFAITPLHAADSPTLARCVEYDMADVLIDGVDDTVLRSLVMGAAFHTRFSTTFAEPPAALGLSSQIQRESWRCVVAHAGLPIQTATIAKALGITREHLSRAFAAGQAPNLKRTIDFVRLIAAAELAKNPGYDLRDVATVLAFASPSHLSSTSQRVLGMRPTSLARLRSVDLIDRFTKGRARSRNLATQTQA